MKKIDVLKYDQIAREVFAPVYPLIAEQIVQNTGIKEGICLDIGSGGGYLAIALAKITDLNFYLLDCSQEFLAIASKNIADHGLNGRAKTLHGDVHQIPLDDCSINLVVSRGSYRFWNDQRKAFEEIYRVLAPGGMGYIGGGLGSSEIKERIFKEMRVKYSEWCDLMDGRRRDNVQTLNENLRKAGILTYEINRDDTGLWTKIIK
jgi:ubiquinone/menaquinone biosynthesis C-methylase UbiE